MARPVNLMRAACAAEDDGRRPEADAERVDRRRVEPERQTVFAGARREDRDGDSLWRCTEFGKPPGRMLIATGTRTSVLSIAVLSIELESRDGETTRARFDRVVP